MGKMRCIQGVFLMGAMLLLGACSSAKIVSSHDLPGGTGPAPVMIYVSDFDIDPNSVKSEGLLSRLPLHVLTGPSSQAKSLVDLMGESIVKDLSDKGLPAYRLPAGAPLPQQGWLVRGAFLQVDAGNRLRRAVIGFGAGQTNLQVAVAIDNLTSGNAPAPIYSLQTDAESSKRPGAVVTLNPYAAAVKFVMAGHDLDTNAKDTAKKIAEDIVARVKGPS